jgi:leucyl-tRNA synthetase
MSDYNFENIENKWREKWFKDNIYEAVDFSPKPKKYILAELPYPSGKFLHVGHMMRYTVPEIYSRYLRMRGYNVLFPMGWDCFGLPTETFAIKEGITPQEAIARATVEYKLAMQRMGYAMDWSREINTSDPSYYKWTQWTFNKLWEKGLAIQEEMPVWWCQELGVLADEEVLPAPDGINKISERGGYPVQKKLFKQWVLKLPDYAERLLEGLDRVEYTDSVKAAQRNWIGKKTGAFVTFECNGQKIEAFTTRPDTIYGVTFLAISPESSVVANLLSFVENKAEVEEYIKKTKASNF